MRMELPCLNFIAWMIVACEIAFWLVIILGLVVRYVLKKDRLGLFFLALTPVIDLLLLVITGVDLYRGAVATMAHGIAAIYIGVSIVFGKSMIKWADERFRYYVTKEGPKPVKRYGIDYSIHYLKGFGRHILSYIIGAGALVAIIYFINDASRTEALVQIWKIWSLALGIDFVVTISYFIWPPRQKSIN